MHSSVIGKIEKAHRYARERDRITVERLAVTFAGDDGANDVHPRFAGDVGDDVGQQKPSTPQPIDLKGM